MSQAVDDLSAHDLTEPVQLTSSEICQAARRTLAPLFAALGVTPISELMADLDRHVLEVHGPVPDTPTWEDLQQACSEDHQSGITAATAVPDSAQQ